MTRQTPHSIALAHLQNRLQYQFTHPKLLLQALTHRSHARHNYERLEFVGDGILNYTIARMLFDAFPDLDEGALSRLRGNLVNQTVLANIARNLGIGDVLLLGRGELKSGGADRDSILADALEAIFAAISFDADLHTATETVRHIFAQQIESIDLNQQIKDPKSRLQEALQARRLPVPKYRIENQITDNNGQPQFEIACDLGELGYITYATAPNRREAEKECAQTALEWLQKHHPHHSDRKKAPSR